MLDQNKLFGTEEAGAATSGFLPHKSGYPAAPLPECKPEATLDEPLLSVVVPVFNERQTIDEIIRRVLAAPYEKQVIVVDDGSTDGTSSALEKWEGHPKVELLQHSRNRGKAAAIRTGLDSARGRFTIIQDADLEYDPEQYPALIELLVRGEAQVVYGSRYLEHLTKPPGRTGQSPFLLRGLRKKGDSPRRSGGWMFRWGVSLLNVAARVLYGVRLSDEATCYKAFPTDLLKSLDLQCERFEFCPEVTAKVCRLGLTIREVPIRYHARSKHQGKKIRWRDGVMALRTLWKWRNWRPRN
jgi:dolichol-phosphate mannosyltransferase